MPGEARQQVLRGVERDDAARLQHRDAAAQRLGLLEIVRGEDDRVAVAVELADEAPQALPQLDVDARRGLVEHDHGRLVHERLADQHAPLHAARQRAHVGVGLRRQVEVMQDLVDPRRPGRAGRNSPPGIRASRARVKNGSNTSSCGTTPRLRRAARKSATTSWPRMRAVPRSARVSPARIEISVVLPAPFGPQQPEELAPLDRQVDAGQRLHGAEAARDIDDFDGGSQGSDSQGSDDAQRATRAASGVTAANSPRCRRRGRATSSIGGMRANGSARLPSAAARRFSASSTASAAESACARPAMSTMPDAGSGRRAARVEHGRGVVERQRAANVQRSPSAANAPGSPRRRVVHLAGAPWFFAVSVLIRPSTPPFLICSLNSSR